MCYYSYNFNFNQQLLKLCLTIYCKIDKFIVSVKTELKVSCFLGSFCLMLQVVFNKNQL